MGGGDAVDGGHHPALERRAVDPQLVQRPGGQRLPHRIVGRPQLLDGDVRAGLAVPLGQAVHDLHLDARWPRPAARPSARPAAAGWRTPRRPARPAARRPAGRPAPTPAGASSGSAGPSSNSTRSGSAWRISSRCTGSDATGLVSDRPGHLGLVVEQPPLARQPPAVAAEGAVGRDHPVAGHDDRDRVAAVGLADGAARPGPAHLLGDVAVRERSRRRGSSPARPTPRVGTGCPPAPARGRTRSARRRSRRRAGRAPGAAASGSWRQPGSTGGAPGSPSTYRPVTRPWSSPSTSSSPIGLGVNGVGRVFTVFMAVSSGGATGWSRAPHRYWVA